MFVLSSFVVQLILKLHLFDLLWICFKQAFRIRQNPQQIEPMELEAVRITLLSLSTGCARAQTTRWWRHPGTSTYRWASKTGACLTCRHSVAVPVDRKGCPRTLFDQPANLISTTDDRTYFCASCTRNSSLDLILEQFISAWKLCTSSWHVLRHFFIAVALLSLF